LQMLSLFNLYYSILGLLTTIHADLLKGTTQ
jgi:hypothetical protein